MKTKTKTFVITDKISWAFSVDGIDVNTPHMPFGRQIDEMRKALKFCETARHTWIDCKHKPTMQCVKKWVKEFKPVNFWARWNSDSEWYKDDSVQIYFDRFADE